jgi:hypothetical protein
VSPAGVLFGAVQIWPFLFNFFHLIFLPISHLVILIHFI